MKDFFKDNENKTSSSSDNVRAQGKIRPQDIIEEQELKAKEAQEVYHKIYKDLEESCAEMDTCINEECDTPEVLIDKIFDFFQGAFDEAGVEDEKDYQKIKEFFASKARKRDQLLSMLEFIKSLLKKLFSAGSSLSWQERLKKEIEDLEKELLDKDLSPEEWLSKLERLNLLKFVDLFGPLNFIGAVVKALTIFVAFEATSLVGEGFIKELLVKEKVVLPENRGVKEEITDKFIISIVNMLSDAVPFAKSIGELLSIAVIESVTAGIKTELGIVDTRIPYVVPLLVTPEPVVKKLPVEEVRTKPVEEPKVEKKPEKPAAPEPKVAPKPKIKSPDESRTVVEGRERQRSNDPRVQFLLAQANESNVPPSTVQDPQLAQHISGLNLGRSQN
ncbi:MAG TPA: hypothetical protein DEQ74_02190 [Wolbachia sp.]|uniref:hypothetical protein n=1 Tax=Wolbachia endosymbiont of Pentalonia nigronervosa TaxID=1301914 RepID=UPI000EEFC133|nr:hypothetical protein [Wolbachia endosymbiont of Pentalonia nigronervosa]MBD0391206.1 hypothetical protein [Wolbachia endosymbiont of Pentalonia nigronervosa]HCE59619.1 hypothetical protein [Wolbachia sp.]